jgi:hypothetical protein
MWLEDATPSNFDQLMRPFNNFLANCSPDNPRLNRIVWPLMFKWLNMGEFVADAECARLLKQIFERLARSKDIYDFRNMWENFLINQGHQIRFGLVADLVRTCVRKASGLEKRLWEAFEEGFVIPLVCRTETHEQTCTITMRGCSDVPAPTLPRNVVIWNGNGIRARWLSERNEFRELVEVTDPDVVCFLESKTNSDKLLALQGFDEWADNMGFRNIHCYWSKRRDQAAHGCEGIMIFTKMPCKVSYGIGDEELDMQARVVTAEFADFFLLVTYHPQGGFSEESLAFRAKWEAYDF